MQSIKTVQNINLLMDESKCIKIFALIKLRQRNGWLNGVAMLAVWLVDWMDEGRVMNKSLAIAGVSIYMRKIQWEKKKKSLVG